MIENKVTVIGAGLAGSEAALTLAEHGVNVELIECKPSVMSAAHSDKNYCELVCSNSLKSNDILTAHGLLKAELRALNSHVLKAADECTVPAGSALAVDRKQFAALVTKRIEENPYITVKHELAESLPQGLVIIASGPLTISPLDKYIKERFGNLHFYDAEAPIVSAESIDYSSAYFGARYGKGNGDDYLNCPLTKEEYEAFYEALISAERADKHEFEKGEIFEGCMPVEVMAARGKEALRFGPMRPVGLRTPDGSKPYAVLQLRKENVAGDMFNLVGFQTNLKFSEQKRVFGIIPALRNAEYHRYGVMHRNTFINAPEVIDSCFCVKNQPEIMIAGQLSGVEGYVESIASGKLAAMSAISILKGKKPEPLPETTMLGCLSRYIATPNENFQPMNSNYGLMPPLEEHIRDKAERKRAMYERSMNSIKKAMEI